jgi:hypothetical protein
MIDANKGSQKAEFTIPVGSAALEQRVLQLEKALLEYVERYGLTDKAREVFQISAR